MAYRRGQWNKKLNDEMCIYAVGQMACGKTAAYATKMLKERYGVDISAVRVNKLKDEKRWLPLYNDCMKEYRKKQLALVGIEVAAKEYRLKETDTLVKNLGKIIKKIEVFIDNRIKDDELTKSNLSSFKTLMYILNSTIKNYKELLAHAQKETDVKKNEENYGNGGNNGGESSFLNFINVNMGVGTDGKAKELPRELPKELPKVIDTKVIDTKKAIDIKGEGDAAQQG